MTWTPITAFTRSERRSEKLSTLSCSAGTNAKLRLIVRGGPDWWKVDQEVRVFLGQGEHANSLRVELAGERARDTIKLVNLGGSKDGRKTSPVLQMLPFAGMTVQRRGQDTVKVEFVFGSGLLFVTLPGWCNQRPLHTSGLAVPAPITQPVDVNPHSAPQMGVVAPPNLRFITNNDITDYLRSTATQLIPPPKPVAEAVERQKALTIKQEYLKVADDLINDYRRSTATQRVPLPKPVAAVVERQKTLTMEQEYFKVADDLEALISNPGKTDTKPLSPRRPGVKLARPPADMAKPGPFNPDRAPRHDLAVTRAKANIK